MPTRKRDHCSAQSRKEDAVWQNALLVSIEAVAPVGAENGKQGDSYNRMGPGCSAGADASDNQKLGRAGKCGKQAEQETGARRPKCGPGPEDVTAPPVENVRTEKAKGQRHGERHAHGVNGMPQYRDAGFRLRVTRSCSDWVDKLFPGIRFAHCRKLLILGTAAAGLTLSGCQGEYSTLDPAGPAARSIATLWWVMLIGAAIILLLVMGLLAAGFRRNKKEVGDAAHMRFWIVGLGLGFSMSVLAALLAYGLVVGERLLPRADAEVVEVHAQAERWRWRFSYASQPNFETENVLHIPAGRPVDVHVTSLDVVHSFWVPRLAGKLDAIPGHVNRLRIEADQPGVFKGLTAEFNGEGYGGHVFDVIAHAPDTWEAFLREEAR